jgi:alpha-amylase/alpha-mannosidase (GH57 family)
MSRTRLMIAVALVLCAAAGSAAHAAADAAAPGSNVLYLSLVWHQHQPLYYKDAGVFTRPWARVHATKDYYDMAAMLQRYPDVHVTFNLTPVLIRQLDALAAGTKDAYQVAAEKPAAALTGADKLFILQRFFDANWTNVIARFPRYQELLAKRGGTTDAAIADAVPRFTEQDYRDLQMWFNLAWFDPDFLAVPPLSALVEKGRGFAEADKNIVFDKAREVVGKVIPLHKALQEKGQIEVITTPYAHPILPLVYNSSLAARGDPLAALPTRFSWPNDAIAQVKKAVEVYRQHYGRAPRGMWPGEGAVGQDIVKMVADNGFRWMASGEQVLAKSIGRAGFTRSSRDVVYEADDLYRPWYVRHADGPRVAVFFRDLRLSDLLGFEYSGTPGEAAADDFMARLEAIRSRLAEQGATGPHVVSIILDGENAWENYPNDGKAFLNALYRKLSESTTVRTVTPSEYLARFPEQRTIDSLWNGCWFTPDFTTWIGEAEENLGWEYLGKTRNALAQYDLTKKKTTTPERLAKALDAMYLAEGSDWFWWYGADQDSGNDRYFDDAFRALLREVYVALGEPVPDFVRMPIIQPDTDAAFAPGGPLSLRLPDLGTLKDVLAVDDPAGDDHGAGGTTYPTDPVFEKGVFDIERFSVAQDDQNLVLRFAVAGPIANPWNSGIGLSVQTFDVYIDVDPGAGTGPRRLLEGRNASLPKGNGWEYAVWVEGWHQKLIVPDANGRPVEAAGGPVKAVVNAAKREVTILVSKKALVGFDAEKAAYIGVLASQDGYPAAGVRRIREVLAASAQWRAGGAPADTNHTRIFDVAWPAAAAPTQEQFLSAYPPSQEPAMDALAPDDFAQVPMLAP